MFRHFHQNIMFSDLDSTKSNKHLQDLQNDSMQIAYGLRAISQDKIGLFLDDTYHFVASLFGTLLARKTPYLLNSPQTTTNDMFLLDDEKYSQNLKCENLKYGNKQKHLEQTPQKSLSHKESLSHTANTNISLSNAQFFIQTSGSSGEPKFIAKNLYQMICEARFLAGFFTLNSKNDNNKSEVVFIGAIPHRHLFGLTFKVFLPLVCGGVVLREQILSHHLLVEALDTHKNAILLASPTVLEIMLKDEISYIKSPKIIICAGSPLDSHTRDGLQKRFNAKQKQTLQNIISIYGSSETGVIGYQDSKTTSHPIDKSQNHSSTFCAFPPVRLELDFAQRLVISSDWLDSFEGENAKFLSNDCAKIYDNNAKDSKVVFTLLGRYDRIIKLNEARISLDFVESVLKNHSFIDNVRVGVLKGQKRLSAIITLTNEGKNAFRTQGKKGIKSALKPLLDSASKDSNISLVSALRYFIIRSALPYNAQGKITLKDFEICAREKIVPEFRIVQDEKPKMQIKSSNSSESSKSSKSSKSNGSCEAKSCVLESYIDEGCFYFDGHFGSFPLVPGFVELGFALQNASKYLGIKLESISQIQSVKFSAFLRPCDMARLELVCAYNRLDFSLYANEKICASGKVLLKNQI
ncbi:AMP-binding protein [Helicobacter sp. T3_23-1056]